MTDDRKLSGKNLLVRVGERTLIKNCIEWLLIHYYVRDDEAKYYGQFSVHGDRITVRAVNFQGPIIIDFFGDTIEKIQEHLESSTVLIEATIAPNIIDADGVRFEPGQYVVHLDHGVGQFRTLALKEVLGNDHRRLSPYTATDASTIISKTWKPFLVIDYFGGSELFVPPEQVGKMTHYIGARSPVLSKLGSISWQKTKAKVEEDLFKLAKELLTIAAKREVYHRPPFNINYDWVNMVADNFPYAPTDDQSKAISDVLRDFDRTKPMDRLICGDVGFGKTEVALRAAVAIASSGGQVVILAPTTILVEQHLVTFRNRLKDLPFRVEAMSRFVAKDRQSIIVKDLRTGAVDIIIGTHRLLKSDIVFNDLKLLIIDEEQKFGVRHKEMIKQKRAEIDVLTMSATPIPRTLFTSLSGLRDISLIMTPPKNRLPIQTIIQKHDDTIIKTAITAELKRHGQVFVLHNDVASIEARAFILRQLVPTAKIAVAHGQMPEAQLIKVLRQMNAGEIDVLVTSTIIENGIDMPQVNTLIVEKCDHFGLADLYQIRGRVGRSIHQAYAYFLYETGELTTAATARFRALKESEMLGSGYSIALRDLEIRGGGNVLGRQQHGNMEAVGLSLYAKMLQQMVQKLK